MARLTVLHYPDPRLRNPAQPVTEVDDSIRRLAADMLETMYDERGIGLAATQVNVAKRIAVIDLSEHRDAPLTLINPEIIASEGTEPSQEGCLSVPGFFETIERAARVHYRYITEAGKQVEAEADGLMAICLQHEIDHLNGKLFIDHLSPLKRRRFEKKLEKQEKLRAPAL